MSDQYCGEIRMFAGWGGYYCISGWAFCSGTVLTVTSNPALFSLISTTWGGDGINTFCLPDMRGRTPIHYGKGTGITNKNFGTSIGYDEVILEPENLPSHNHPMQASTAEAKQTTANGTMLGQPNEATFYDDPEGSRATNQFSIHAVNCTGGNVAHENCMPSMALSFIIALKGIYPDRP